MSIERRIMFGPGFAAEVYVVRGADGQLQGVLDPATGLPVALDASQVAFAASPGGQRGVTVAEGRGLGQVHLDARSPGAAVLLDARGPGFVTFEVRDRFEPVTARREPPPPAYRPAPTAVAEPVDAERARGPGTGTVRFALLGQIGAALAETLAANREVMERASPRDRRETAEDLASAVLQTLGVELPNTTWIPHTRESRTWGGQLRLGDDLVTRLPLPALVQLLLHQAGRVHERSDGTAARHLVDALHHEGLLSKDEHAALRASDDATSETYAALGAWIFNPAQRPQLAGVLAHLDAPEGAAPRDDRGPSGRVALLLGALDRARDTHAFEQLARHDGDLRTIARAHEDARPAPWAFGDE